MRYTLVVVWPVIHTYVTIADLFTEARADLPRAAAVAGARVHGSPELRLEAGSSVEGWHAYDLVVTARVPATSIKARARYMATANDAAMRVRAEEAEAV